MQLTPRSNLCVTAILVGLLLGTFMIGEVLAQDKAFNLYTARHYSTDEAFYTGYTKATGIKINRIEGGEDALFERIKAEGANSPADVFLTVDVARLWRAEQTNSRPLSGCRGPLVWLLLSGPRSCLRQEQDKT
jgi:iron(III) transport system substrate-binding protein